MNKVGMHKACLLITVVFAVVLSVVDGVCHVLIGTPRCSPAVIGALSIIIGHLIVEEDG